MQKPKLTLALLQHQINWWGNFNVDHFERVLEAKESAGSRAQFEETIIFLPAFGSPKPTIWNNLKWIRIHK
jgi:hypothetical protein